MRVHLDNDLLVHALSRRGPERRALESHERAGHGIAMSALAWYEFCRGPRTPQQLAVGRAVLDDDGIVPLSEELAALAGEVFRSLGSPRRRAADIAIGVIALSCGARLLTRNARDFAGIPELDVVGVLD